MSSRGRSHDVTASAGWIKTYITPLLDRDGHRGRPGSNPAAAPSRRPAPKKLFKYWTLYDDPERCRPKKPHLCKSSDYNHCNRTANRIQTERGRRGSAIGRMDGRLTP